MPASADTQAELTAIDELEAALNAGKDQAFIKGSKFRSYSRRQSRPQRPSDPSGPQPPPAQLRDRTLRRRGGRGETAVAARSSRVRRENAENRRIKSKSKTKIMKMSKSKSRIKMRTGHASWPPKPGSVMDPAPLGREQQNHATGRGLSAPISSIFSTAQNEAPSEPAVAFGSPGGRPPGLVQRHLDRRSLRNTHQVAT